MQTDDDADNSATATAAPASATDGDRRAPGGDAAAAEHEPPRLVVPPGLLIDDIVRERMERRLNRLPADVDGIAAPLEDVPAGASCRVHAEWRSLQPSGEADTLQPTVSPVRGAVLLRAGVPFEVSDSTVDAPGARLVIDAGAVVHDPRRPVGRPEVASKRGRPPFPRRPVVVVLGVEPDTRRAEWARRLCNGLLRRDIEARLAVPDPPEGMNLARPCMPCEESIRALAPDAIVALDAAAAERAPHWCGSDRSTVILHLSDDIAGPVELVPWQIDRAEGRLRARIGTSADPMVVSALVRRLCAGPHPIAPTGSIRKAARPRPPERAPASTKPRPSALLLTGLLDDEGAARLDGMLDYLSAEGVRAGVAPLDDGVPHGAQSAPLVMLLGAAGTPGLHELIARRRESRLATVLDVGPSDLLRQGQSQGGPPRLTEQAGAAAVACAKVSAPAGATARAAQAPGADVFVLPTLVARTRAAALRGAVVAEGDPDDGHVIGWRVDSGGRPVPRYAEAVVDALLAVIERDDAIRVHAVAERTALPARLRRHDAVSVTKEAPRPDEVAAWTVNLFVPEIISGEIADDLTRFVEAGLAGVPTVLPLAARRAIDGHPSPQLAVRDAHDPKAWIAAMRSVLGDEKRRARRVDEALRHASALNGHSASRATINRFVGWALAEGER